MQMTPLIVSSDCSHTSRKVRPLLGGWHAQCPRPIHVRVVSLTPGCINTSAGATDVYGDTCDYYDSNPTDCGAYDDDDFHAEEMCCSCLCQCPADRACDDWCYVKDQCNYVDGSCERSSTPPSRLTPADFAPSTPRINHILGRVPHMYNSPVRSRALWRATGRKAVCWKQQGYNSRRTHCKLLRGFQIRMQCDGIFMLRKLPRQWSARTEPSTPHAVQGSREA